MARNSHIHVFYHYHCHHHLSALEWIQLKWLVVASLSWNLDIEYRAASYGEVPQKMAVWVSINNPHSTASRRASLKRPGEVSGGGFLKGLRNGTWTTNYLERPLQANSFQLSMVLSSYYRRSHWTANWSSSSEKLTVQTLDILSPLCWHANNNLYIE